MNCSLLYRQLMIVCILVHGLSSVKILHADELEQIKDELEAVSFHSKVWQYGWTTIFTVSIGSHIKTLATDESDEDQKFDARIGMLTSGSGLASTIWNPLPAVSISSFRDMPEETFEERKLKTIHGRQLLLKSWEEIQRRRSFAFQMFVLTEQLLAAGAIGILDERPKDAWLRFSIGMITSELFIYTTPVMNPKVFGNEASLTWHLIPDGIAINLSF